MLLFINRPSKSVTWSDFGHLSHAEVARQRWC